MLIFIILFPDLIKFPYFMDTPEKRVWGERRLKDRLTLQITLVFTLTLTCPKTFTRGHVSVFDKYLHWPCVSVFKKKIHFNRISKCKRFECVSVNRLHLHWIYTLTLTHTTLVKTLCHISLMIPAKYHCRKTKKIGKFWKMECMLR
jgi:hypothetical protein